jgi:alanine racemase
MRGTTWCGRGTRCTATFRRRAARGPRQILDVQPALTWKAKILAVKDIPEGTLVGYGGTFRAPSAMRIAILGAGYADGVFHRLSNRGKVIAAGQIVPIVGTISMDLTTIDVSHAPELKPGDDVTLLGAEGDARLDAQQIARWRARFLTISCRASARACGGCTCDSVSVPTP